MALGNYAEGLKDAQQSVRLDEKYVKGYVRIVRCSLALGEVAVAERAITRILELNDNRSIIKSLIEKFEHLRQTIHAPPSLWTYLSRLNRTNWTLKKSPALLKFKMIRNKVLVKFRLFKVYSIK